MKSRASTGRRRSGYTILCGILVFLAMLCSGFSGPSFSGDVRVVKGVVERISGKYIVVAGERYDVAGVPVAGDSGKHRSGAIIRGGDKVELSLREGKVTSLRNLGPVLQ